MVFQLLMICGGAAIAGPHAGPYRSGKVPRSRLQAMKPRPSGQVPAGAFLRLCPPPHWPDRATCAGI